MTDFSSDTNIIFYAFDRRDLAKQEIANRILERAYRSSSSIALQVLSEFYRSASRKIMLAEEASIIVADLRRRLSVVAADERDLVRAMELHQQYHLQFFDSLLLATLARNGVHLFFSEDMQHESLVGGLLIVNPFKLTSAELDLLLS